MLPLSRAGCAAFLVGDLPGGVRLSPKAESDLEEIWYHTASAWSETLADRYIENLVVVFDLLLVMPKMAYERTEFVPPVRIHPTGTHLVIYRTNGDFLDILRVLSGRQDWQILLESLE